MKKLFQWFIVKCNKNKCTCWFDSFKKWSWGECCQDHDNAYIMRRSSTKTKWQIDMDLYRCVSKKTCKVFGAIMWIGNKTFSWIGWRMYK